MNDIMISAIITTYKREPTIVWRAFQSVIKQTYENMEIIVVDDSPNTYCLRRNVAALFQQNFNRKVTYIQHEMNQGACAARNTGTAVAKGEFVAFLDDDDEWVSNKIQRMVQCYKRSGAGLIYADRYSIINDDTEKIVEKKNKAYRGYVFDKLMEVNFIGSTSFPMIKKECLIDSGGFDTDLRASQDYDMWLRVSQITKVDYVSEVLCIYHVHSTDSITNNASNKIQGIIHVIRKYEEYYKKHPSKYGKRLIALVPNYIKIGEIDNAILIYKKVIKLAPFNFYTNIKWLIYMILRMKEVRHK